MNNLFFLKYFIVLFFVVPNSIKGQSQTAELVKQIEIILDSSYFNYGWDARQQKIVSARFDSLFNLLTDFQKNNPVVVLDENTIGHKILAIADYKALHPELFTEIESRYIYKLDTLIFRAPRSPYLNTEHIAENYRMVWEYYLLKPPGAKILPHYDYRATEALSKINNPASLIIFESVYRYSTKTKIPLEYPVIHKQQLLLSDLVMMPSESGLNTMLRMLAIKNPEPYPNRNIVWQPEQFVKDIFSGQNYLKTESQWKEVIRKIDVSKLDLNSKKMMDALNLKN
jgi:hypothetical protein